jgi:heme-degrading monooxygenase HmoA
MAAMIVIVWEFRVQPGQAPGFERAYGPEGDWARLFRRSPAYRGTELLRDQQDPERYLTLDRWDGASDFDAFKAGNGEDYRALDKACEPLCSKERLVGRFACTSSCSTSTAP